MFSNLISYTTRLIRLGFLYALRSEDALFQILRHFRQKQAYFTSQIFILLVEVFRLQPTCHIVNGNLMAPTIQINDFHHRKD